MKSIWGKNSLHTGNKQPPLCHEKNQITQFSHLRKWLFLCFGNINGFTVVKTLKTSLAVKLLRNCH